MDFYIASECGAVSQKGENQIAIVSRDKGFNAIVDFLQIKQDIEDMSVVIAENVEEALLKIKTTDNASRRKVIYGKRQMLDLGEEYARYIEKSTLKGKLESVLCGTEYEFLLNEIIDLLGENSLLKKKELYIGTLHNFGQRDGRAIYHLLKEVV